MSLSHLIYRNNYIYMYNVRVSYRRPGGGAEIPPPEDFEKLHCHCNKTRFNDS